MPDMERVIKWLEICIKGCDDSCPYKKECESKGGFTEPMRDALALLKAQEPRAMADTELEAIRKAPLILKPNVDAVPVVHGRWIEVDEGDGDYTYDCSVCGGKWWLAADTPEANGMKYCPYCGAKMDGERRDSE